MSKTRTITVTPTLSTGAYAANDALGSAMFVNLGAFRDDGGVRLEDAVLTDAAGQTVALDVIVMRSQPATTVFIDNAQANFADAAVSAVLGAIPITAAHAFTANGAMRAVDCNMVIGFENAAADDFGVWVGLVTRGTPTYGANVADLNVNLKLTFSSDV